MPVRTIRAFLDENDVRYVIVQHSPAYTAPEIAESVHVSGRAFAKSVMVRLDGHLAVVVVPATQQVDLDALAAATGAQRVELAEESEFAACFPDCDPGSVPPFGNLFGLPVYISAALPREEELVFNAGRHTEVMRLAYSDFERLVSPTVVDI
ncbi:YbaK/EbsC family protein [Ectothiorhodospiraceae bacterium WFHF3C12]|nr:YbaK/EbsC family protein [Ectothiorhodospiraceae bacterium WFHF3C12]